MPDGPSASSATLADVRCEYRVDPLGIESAAPRLSWIARTEARGWRQSAYQILVASEPEKLEEGGADLWDSGQVESDASIQIAYAGKTLEPRQLCLWKVRVWDADGKASGWSPVQRWEMGLLSESDWGMSDWIGGHEQEPSPAPAPHFRQEFASKGRVVRARLYASGIGYVEFRLNGKKLGGEAVREPGYTNFDKCVLYVVYDVTEEVREGPNALGAILGTGWYDVHDLAVWGFDKATWRGRPKLRVSLFLEYADGRTEFVGSDSSWKTSSGPIVRDGIYSGEVYDARLEMPGWDCPGFDDSSWKPAQKMPAPKGKLSARACPPVAVRETIRPKSITEPMKGVFVVDFGQNMSGHARLRVRGNVGHTITLRYSERLGTDGMIDRSQIESLMVKTDPPQIFQTDTYICKGGGEEVWEQRFAYHGFQYVEVTDFPGKPKPEDFEARFASTDFETAGEFECSNELLNRIQKATRAAYLSNAQSIPTDCPQREKNGWTGDAHLAAECGLMNFRSSSFYTKWLDDLYDDQGKDGQMSLVVPSGGWGRDKTHPAWDSAYPIIAQTLWRYFDDDRALEKHYGKLKRYVDFLHAQTEDDVVPFDSLDDWVPWSTKTPSTLTSTIFLVIDARIVAETARMLGKDVDARTYGDLAERVKEAYGRHFLAGSFDELSQTALAMTVYFEMADGAGRKEALEALIRNVERQSHIDTGILGAKYVLRVLSEAGRTDLAYKLVARTEQPGWGWWIEQGATTLWEDWKGEYSRNHIMFGDVSNWLFQWIAGIGLDPEVRAFKHILFRPQPVGDLTWAKSWVMGPCGRIASSWTREGDRFTLEIEVPANTTATVRVPGHCQIFDGATFSRQKVDATIYEIGSGAYRIGSRLG